MQFKFYVLNHNFNKRCIEQYNIFNNILVQEAVEKEIKKYLRNKKRYSTKIRRTGKEVFGFEALCEEIRAIIMWQEWSRCEYEIAVGEIFIKEIYDIKREVEQGKIKKEELYDYILSECERNGKLEKWDCYQQCEKNIEIIARECIWQYKQQIKQEKE